jgi:hypothetical protein
MKVSRPMHKLERHRSMAKTGRSFTIAWLLFAASFLVFRGVSLPGDWLYLLLLVVLGFYGARRWILSAAIASRLERELSSKAN